MNHHTLNLAGAVSHHSACIFGVMLAAGRYSSIAISEGLGRATWGSFLLLMMMLMMLMMLMMMMFILTGFHCFFGQKQRTKHSSTLYHQSFSCFVPNSAGPFRDLRFHPRCSTESQPTVVFYCGCSTKMRVPFFGYNRFFGYIFKHLHKQYPSRRVWRLDFIVAVECCWVMKWDLVRPCRCAVEKVCWEKAVPH